MNAEKHKSKRQIKFYYMKKLFFAVVAIALVAGFSSCKKECTCKSYQDDVLISTTTYETKGPCADLNTKTTAGSITLEMKCE